MEESATPDQNRKAVQRRIKLRNHLFDVLMSHFTTETNEFDTK